MSGSAAQPDSVSEEALQMVDVHRSYMEAGSERPVLDGAAFTARRGTLTAITGPSGSGKSTVLNILGGIDSADSGRVVIDGIELGGLNERQKTLFRRNHIGFVFQFFNLVPTLTVMENLRLPLMLADKDANPAIAMEWLSRFGLADRAAAYPDVLSGGEQQRIAIIRAAIHEPGLVLADEPTGNLDEDSGESVLKLFRDIVDGGATVVMVTHSDVAAAISDQHLVLSHGKLERPESA